MGGGQAGPVNYRRRRRQCGFRWHGGCVGEPAVSANRPHIDLDVRRCCSVRRAARTNRALVRPGPRAPPPGSRSRRQRLLPLQTDLALPSPAGRQAQPRSQATGRRSEAARSPRPPRRTTSTPKMATSRATPPTTVMVMLRPPRRTTSTPGSRRALPTAKASPTATPATPAMAKTRATPPTTATAMETMMTMVTTTTVTTTTVTTTNR